MRRRNRRGSACWQWTPPLMSCEHLLAEHPRGLRYRRDELSGWLGNHNRYGGHGGDRAFF
jgi:hypothetical protein